VVDERLERIRDLAGVPQIVVEDQRHQRNWRRTVTVEHVLAVASE